MCVCVCVHVLGRERGSARKESVGHSNPQYTAKHNSGIVLEQCSLTGGRRSSLARSVFLMEMASSSCIVNQVTIGVARCEKPTTTMCLCPCVSVCL